MSEIYRAFQRGKAFVAFVTAGDPDLQTSERYIEVIAEAGADLVEIGIPFSDPIAEGEVIQAANLRALKNDVSLKKIFAMCGRLKQRIQTPLVFLTYLNPVFVYGYDAFFADCAKNGVSGVILPDCPFEEQGEVRRTARQYGVDVVSLLAPTSGERTEKIARAASGFLYLVSSMGVTGVRSEIATDVAGMVAAVRKVSDVPICVGFGISTPQQAQSLSRVCDGVIVGSAIVNVIARLGNAADAELKKYVADMKAACNDIKE